MATSIQALGGANQISIESGDGQYVVLFSDVSVYVIRQQLLGQALIAYAFLNDTDLTVRFQFTTPPTTESHAVLVEIEEALHTAHSVPGNPLPPIQEMLVKTVEGAAQAQLVALGVRF